MVMEKGGVVSSVPTKLDSSSFFFAPPPLPIKLLNFQEAVVDCSRSLRFLGSVKAFSRCGAAHLALQNWEWAFDDFQRGLELQPQNQECVGGMGSCIAGLAVCSQDASILEPLHFRHRVAKAQLKWHCPKISGNPKAPPLTGHQMVTVESAPPKTEKCLVFGGRSVMQTLETILQLDENYWTERTVSGTPPCNRSWHTCCLVDGVVIMFGGITKSGETNEVVLFDPKDNRWQAPIVLGTPPAERSGHTMNVAVSDMQSDVWVAGGRNRQGFLADMAMLALHPLATSSGSGASESIASPAGGVMTTRTLEWSSTGHPRLPRGRDGHSASFVAIEENSHAELVASTSVGKVTKLVVFGGNVRNESPPESIGSKATTQSLLQGSATGTGANSAESTSFQDCKTNEVLELDLSSLGGGGVGTCEWKKVSTSGENPEPRSFHSATTIDNLIFIHGGRGVTGELNDLYILDASTYVWHRPAVLGHDKIPTRAWHTTTVLTRLKQICIFGGGNEGGPLDTVVTLDVSGLMLPVPEASEVPVHK
jgi:hypothetical protein